MGSLDQTAALPALTTRQTVRVLDGRRKNGGRRPGAGGKPQSLIEWRKRMELTFARTVSEADVEAAVRTWVKMWIKGEAAPDWLVDRIFGKVRDEALIEFRGALAIKYVNDWREQG